jgi:hypothetical protein
MKIKYYGNKSKEDFNNQKTEYCFGLVKNGLASANIIKHIENITNSAPSSKVQ